MGWPWESTGKARLTVSVADGETGFAPDLIVRVFITDPNSLPEERRRLPLHAMVLRCFLREEEKSGFAHSSNGTLFFTRLSNQQAAVIIRTGKSVVRQERFRRNWGKHFQTVVAFWKSLTFGRVVVLGVALGAELGFKSIRLRRHPLPTGRY